MSTSGHYTMIRAVAWNQVTNHPNYLRTVPLCEPLHHCTCGHTTHQKYFDMNGTVNNTPN